VLGVFGGLGGDNFRPAQELQPVQIQRK